MALVVDVVSIFPEIFRPVLQVGMTGRALSSEVLSLHLVNPRDFATDRHRSTDDTPYGGGSGMVMLVEPLLKAMQHIEAERGRGHRIFLTPGGKPLEQATVHRLAALEHLVLVCGRYEGVDERLCEHIDEELSIGDFVLTGGELPALVLIDAVTRLQPGVLHNECSTKEESFEQGLLEHPQYTRPAVFEGREVPKVLLSGNHEEIRRWRRQQALLRTRARRPDLFERLALSKEDLRLLKDWETLSSSPPSLATPPSPGVLS
jgi:tRNA (guanine37-N1)-methyltransferase